MKLIYIAKLEKARILCFSVDFLVIIYSVTFKSIIIGLTPRYAGGGSAKNNCQLKP